MQDELMSEFLKYWASERENVSSNHISEISHTVDTDVFTGTDVTPAEPIELVVKYTVTKTVVHRVPVNELGPFLVELAKGTRRWQLG